MLQQLQQNKLELHQKPLVMIYSFYLLGFQQSKTD